MGKFDSDVRLAREMSLLDATLIGVGAMIGAGIFVLIGIAAGVAGPALILSFILNGCIALFTAMSYAELGSCYHDAGGGYLWVKEGLPKWNGFLSGWMSWFAHAVACSLYALGFGAYFEHVLTELSIQIPQWGFLSPQKLLAGATAVLFAYVNFRGASETGKIGNFVTITKIIILFIFCGFGLELMLRSADPLSVFRDFAPHGAGGVFKAMGLTFIAFQGFEVIAQSSEEIRNPRRNIPRAVFLSLLIVVPIYLLVTVVALGSVHPAGMTPWDYLAAQKEIALVEVARGFFAGGGIMILVGGLISTISALNATIYSSSRVAYAMGRDRNFPGIFGRVHAKRRTPHWSIAISAVIIVAMSLSFPIEDVASAADIMFLLLFLQVNLAMISLRKKRPDLDRGFNVPLFPVLSIVGIAMLLFLAVYMLDYSVRAWVATVVWIAAGLIVYRFYASSREIEHARKLLTLDRLAKKQYSVLVYLDHDNDSTGIVEVALAIGKAHDATLIFLRVVEVPEGRRLRLEDAAAVSDDDAVTRAVERADAQGIRARSLVKVARRSAQCVLETAQEEDCNLILEARERRSGLLWRIYGSVFDSTFRQATSEIATLFGRMSESGPQRIIVLAGDDPHSRLALEMAPALCAHFGTDLGLALAEDGSGGETGEAAGLEWKRALLREGGLPDSALHALGPLDSGALQRAAQKGDLILIGRAAGGFLESLLATTAQTEIAERARCSVLCLSEFEEPLSFLDVLLGRGRAKGS